MKLCCCYTASHQELFDHYFQPSLPPGFELAAMRLDGIQTSGDFDGRDYIDCLRRKIRLVVESLADESGETVVWSDVDIVFLDDGIAGDLRRQLETTGADCLFQRDSKKTHWANGGFYVCRANARCAAFFRTVLARLEARPSMHDQEAINRVLADGTALRWDFLPLTFYARTHGWPPGPDIVLYHANETYGRGGVRQKVRQLEEFRWIRRHGQWAVAWSCLPRIPKRLRWWVNHALNRLGQAKRGAFAPRANPG